MRVIGVVGLPASGKGEISKIARGRGIPVVVMGDVIRDTVKEAGLAPTDENFGAVADRLRAEEGMDAIANRCVAAIVQQGTPLVLIDGIRGDAEVRVFQGKFPGFVLVAIDSSFEQRLERLGTRGRSDDVTSAAALRVRDERERRWGLEAALAMADIRIRNDGTLAEYTDAVHGLLDRLERDA
jgi:dephospho-CoA kinase